MLRILSDWCVRSMKWLSIFGTGALARFSRRKYRQTDSSRDEFNRRGRRAWYARATSKQTIWEIRTWRMI